VVLRFVAMTTVHVLSINYALGKFNLEAAVGSASVHFFDFKTQHRPNKAASA
jgi:hypothetical protein